MKIAIASNPDTDYKMLSSLIASGSSHKIAWVTSDESGILDMCKEDHPDLLLFDIAFSKNASNCVKSIMDESPCAILLMASAVEGNEPAIFEAMRWGALDVATIPESLQKKDTCKEFLRHVKVLGRLAGTEAANTKPKQATVAPFVAIGSSTGGPNALRSILADLPADFQGHIVIIQHMDAEFLPGLASWLKSNIKLEVAIALNGDRLEKGKVLIACGPDDLVITKNMTLKTVTPEPGVPFHPSINTFFDSCVASMKNPGVGIILSGMGKDGASGLKAMNNAGWETIAQDEASSAIYGMPKEAAKTGAARHILSVDSIANAILEHTHYTPDRENS